MAMTQPIRCENEIRQLAAYYLGRGEVRNHALFVLCVNTALRISDLLRLTWDDVYDFEKECVLASVSLVESKTKKGKTIALNQSVANALTLLAAESAKPGSNIITNPKTGKAIDRSQAYRIIRSAGENLDFDTRVTCHSLRKTFGYHAWKKGVSPVVIMDIYNHSSLAVTKRYLGVSQDDRDAVYLGLDLTA